VEHSTFATKLHATLFPKTTETTQYIKLDECISLKVVSRAFNSRSQLKKNAVQVFGYKSRCIRVKKFYIILEMLHFFGIERHIRNNVFIV